jgi:hypothetical protein
MGRLSAAIPPRATQTTIGGQEFGVGASTVTIAKMALLSLNNGYEVQKKLAPGRALHFRATLILSLIYETEGIYTLLQH